MTEFRMIYWTAWWVAAYEDRYAVQDKVSRAIVRALQEVGVVLPYQKGSMNVQIDTDHPGFDSPTKGNHKPESPDLA